MPSEIGLLVNLEMLDLLDTKLMGQIPSEIGLCTKLTLLDLQATEVTGTFPSEIGNLAESLGKKFWSSMILFFEMLLFNPYRPSAESLRISGPWLTGTLPTEIGSLSRLTSLSATGGEGSLSFLASPSEIARLSNMKHLHLKWISTPNTSWFADAMLAMTQLTTLTIVEQTDSIGFVATTVPTEIGILTALEYLDLSNSYRTGTLPMACAQLTMLTLLSLAGNDLIGTIPTELGLLTNLVYLSLVENKLTGFLPSEIGELSHLSIAAFQFNQLSPPVPPEVCALGIEISTTFIEGEFLASDTYSYRDGCKLESP